MIRRSWDELPEEVRRAIEAQCGGPVLRTESPSAGRNSALSALLHTANGTVFVKGIPTDYRLVNAHRHEIRVNSWLRHRVSGVPCLLWTTEAGGWLLAGYETVPGEHADLSPGSPDVPVVVDALSRLAEELTPSPAPEVAPLSRKYARLAGWQWLGDNHADQLDAWEKEHLDLLIRLDLDLPGALAGDSLAHADIHGLNLLVDRDRISVIDWAWSRRAAPWVDAALLIIRLIAEGHDPIDAEQLVRSTWGMQHTSATEDAITTFAATTYGQWRRFSIEFPSPHREAPTRGAGLWTRHRLPVS
jgi:hypothetical protein